MRTKKINKKAGFIVSSELILITTIAVIGLVIGLTTVRNAVNTELEDVAEAIGSVDQSFVVLGAINDNGSSTIAITEFTDESDPIAASDGIFWLIDTSLDGTEGDVPSSN